MPPPEDQGRKMLSIADNPPPRWPAGPLADSAGRWWVAHTKARFEKAFAFDLLARRIPYFLPMAERTRVTGGRKRRAMTPLFSGYVFFRGGPDERHRALATDRLCQVIEVADQPRLSRELADLDRALGAGAALDPYPFAAVGRRCRVVAGPFEGLEGIVVRRDHSARLVIEVGMLGQGAAMEIDADLLEPAGPEHFRRPAPRRALVCAE
jgi:hypothetical protein